MTHATDTQHLRLVLAKYRWRIFRDHIADDDCQPGTNSNAKGMEGPRAHDPTITENRATFSMFDDDGECYYEGAIWGDYDGFEPLDDFGTPNAGCSYITYGGERL